ncbi:MAG TPA: class I SAM-dependent methyltransferase, partial [Pseudonocardia sp.]|nr:class I SAM-dependent methyltransferase [Pseudonocardia sp.]
MTHTVALDEAAVAAFAEKVGLDQAVAQGAALAHVGDRLGLWARLAESGPVTPGELAGATGLAERYLREWLATQAAAGYLRHDAATGRFALPPEHAAVLADDDSPAALAGGFALTAAVWSAADRLVEVFRTGRGIGWGEQDPRLFDAVERTFRPLYRASLVDEWLPALDGVVARLEAGARVLDVGCGLGTSSLVIADAFPRSTVAGIDLHAPSVTAARAAA